MVNVVEKIISSSYRVVFLVMRRLLSSVKPHDSASRAGVYKRQPRNQVTPRAVEVGGHSGIVVIFEASVAIVVMPKTAVEEEHVNMVAMTETAVAAEEEHIKSVAVITTALEEEHVTILAMREPAIAVVEKHMKSLAMTDTAVAVEEQHASNVAVTTTAVAVKGTHGKWRVWTRAANSVKRQACRAKIAPRGSPLGSREDRNYRTDFREGIA